MRKAWLAVVGLLVCCPSPAVRTQGSQPAKEPVTQSQPPASQPPASQPTEDLPVPARRLLDHWAKSVRGIRTLRVRFTQKKKLRIMRRPRISQGETLLRGKTVRMQVGPKGKDPELVLLATPKEVRVLLPRHNKLEIYPAAGPGKGKSPFPLMVEDIEALPRGYRIAHRIEGAGEAAREVLAMVPLDKASDFKEVRLYFNAGKLVEVGQTNKKGDTVQMIIDEFTVNPKLPDEALELAVPEGTRIVRVGTPSQATAGK